MTGCLLQLSATIRKILNSSDNCDEQSDLLYTQSPHQVLKCGDWFFIEQVGTLGNFLFLGLSASFRLGEVEHLVKQLEVVVVDDGEVFGDIDICNFVVANVVEGFINITLTELHEIPR